MADLGAIAGTDDVYSSVSGLASGSASVLTAGSLVGDPPSNETLPSAYMAQNITLNPVPIFSSRTVFAPIPENAKTINGHVKNSAGVGIARRVIAVDQVSQTVVAYTDSSAVDGSFTLRPPFANKVTIIAIPDSGDSRNAVVLGDLIPI